MPSLDQIVRNTLTPTQMAAALREPEAWAPKLAKISLRHRAATLYEAGKTIDQVAVEVGFSSAWVRHALAEAGIEPRRRGPRGPADHARIEQIVADVRAAGKGCEIAQKYGLTPERIRQICKKYGGFALMDIHPESHTAAEARARVQRKTDRAAMVAGILSAYDGGISRDAICQKWGLSHVQLGYLLERNGRRERAGRGSRDALIIAAMSAGARQTDIARQLGIPRGTVSQVVCRLRRAGRLDATPAQPQDAAA